MSKGCRVWVGCQRLVGCGCQRLVGCGCRRLVRCVVVEGLKGVWVSKACRMGVEGF